MRTELTTDQRIRVLEAGHLVLTEQQAELGLAMNEGKDYIREIITSTVKAAIPYTMPSAKQLEWLDLLIARETKKAAFEQAVIDKTLTALVWATLAGLGTVLWTMVREYAQGHGWKQ